MTPAAVMDRIRLRPGLFHIEQNAGIETTISETNIRNMLIWLNVSGAQPDSGCLVVFYSETVVSCTRAWSICSKAYVAASAAAVSAIRRAARPESGSALQVRIVVLAHASREGQACPPWLKGAKRSRSNF